MARWKLTEPHYLKVPGTKWELIRQDRTTGRQVRIAYDVPLYLHPEDPGDWNHGDKRSGDGYVVVAYEGKGEPGDIIFEGNPTPGMLPLDKEAEDITKTFSKVWTPTQGIDEISQGDSFSQKLLMGMLDQMSVTKAAVESAPMAPGFEKFMEMMTAMMAQQTQILAAMGGKLADVEFARAGKALGETPIIDDAEPLEAEVELTEEEIKAASEAAAAREAASTQKALDHALSGRR